MPHTILVVDDQPAVRKMLVEALSREAFKVMPAASAIEALEVLKNGAVDVVVSDEKMPGMTGSEFLAVVRRKYPDTIRIILTGHATVELAIRAINEGEIYRFFTKPCNIADLTITIRQALEQRNLQKENKRLLKLVRQQALSLSELEKRSPGITKVKRDSDGAVIIDEE